MYALEKIPITLWTNSDIIRWGRVLRGKKHPFQLRWCWSFTNATIQSSSSVTHEKSYCNYQTMLWKNSLVQFFDLPDPAEYGWKVTPSGGLTIQWFSGDFFFFAWRFTRHFDRNWWWSGWCMWRWQWKIIFLVMMIVWIQMKTNEVQVHEWNATLFNILCHWISIIFLTHMFTMW